MRARALVIGVALVATACLKKDSVEREVRAPFEAKARLAEAARAARLDATAEKQSVAMDVVAGSAQPPANSPGAASAWRVGDSATTPVDLIIRTGQASVEVDSLDPAMERARALAARAGGIVANVSLEAGDARSRTATLELRIPAARFDSVLNGLATLGRVQTVSVTAEDVGEEYVDVAARMDNARRLEQRLLDLLAHRTGKLKDVLAVEQELANVRGQIEGSEGRLRYLRSHAALSTIAVTVHEPFPVVGDNGSRGVIAESLRQAWRNFIAVIAAGIAATGALVPILAVLALGWIVVRKGRQGLGRLIATMRAAPRA